MTTAPDPRGYVASDDVWFRYPGAGDAPAPRGTKLIILTEGGVAIMACWYDGARAWSPLPKRSKLKESQLMKTKE